MTGLRTRVSCALLALGLAAPGPRLVAGTPAVAAAALKAAFIYNFAKFTEWPAGHLPVSAPILVCVVGDAQVADSLKEITPGREINGHPIDVQQPGLDGSLLLCEVMYVSGIDDRQTHVLVDRLRESPVLTVSDQADFAAAGGVANFFVEDGRMRFAVNVEAATRAGLRLSSRLLSVAKVVKG